MWATPSPSTNLRLLVGWVLFASANVVFMYLLPGRETVPFHLVWMSLSVVYGFTTWRPPWMVVALIAVMLTTGVVLVHDASRGVIRWEETTEEPLMAAIFGVMVWHVHRRQVLLREVQRINELDRRRHEMQQLFVRLASHELRTPITVARGYTELLRNAHNNPSAVAQAPAGSGSGTCRSNCVEDIEVILDELNKVSRITQRLVTLMQVDEPHPVRRCAVDAELVRIVRRWQPAADRDWAVHSTIGCALLNPERFEAAIDTLLENAVKFTRPGDRIEVIGESTPDEWHVHVRDNGSGMLPETAHLLLAGPPGQGTSTGSGLGLAIVRTVVESLGGRITITSQPGDGTTVTLRVPHPSWITADPETSVATTAAAPSS